MLFVGYPLRSSLPVYVSYLKFSMDKLFVLMLSSTGAAVNPAARGAVRPFDSAFDDVDMDED